MPCFFSIGGIAVVPQPVSFVFQPSATLIISSSSSFAQPLEVSSSVENQPFLSLSLEPLSCQPVSPFLPQPASFLVALPHDIFTAPSFLSLPQEDEEDDRYPPGILPFVLCTKSFSEDAYGAGAKVLAAILGLRTASCT